MVSELEQMASDFYRAHDQGETTRHTDSGNFLKKQSSTKVFNNVLESPAKYNKPLDCKFNKEITPVSMKKKTDTSKALSYDINPEDLDHLSSDEDIPIKHDSRGFNSKDTEDKSFVDLAKQFKRCSSRGTKLSSGSSHYRGYEPSQMVDMTGESSYPPRLLGTRNMNDSVASFETNKMSQFSAITAGEVGYHNEIRHTKSKLN